MTTISINQLATSVVQSDSYYGSAWGEKIAYILDIALRTRIGMMCLGSAEVVIDLGNGHTLVCSLQKSTKAEESNNLRSAA